MGRTVISPPPPGFRYFPEFLDRTEEKTLLGFVEKLPFQDIVMRGVAARRKSIHFGFDYGYDSARVTPTEPIPEILVDLRDRAASASEEPKESFSAAMVAWYPAGATIGWHRDAPGFGPTVLGISLGDPCIMRFRRKVGGSFEYHKQPLESRSLYRIGGAARTAWQHSIPPVEADRYSITFRSVREKKAVS